MIEPPPLLLAPCEAACDKCCALTSPHIYIDGSRGAAAATTPCFPAVCVCGPARLPKCLARLMDGAHPSRPKEFYLRLTSRCCHHCSPHSTSLINLASSPLSALTIHPFPPSLSLPSYASYGQTPPWLLLAADSQLSQQASLFTLAWPLPFIRLTNKVESKHPHSYTHPHAHTHTRLQWFGCFHGCCLPSAGLK